MSDGLSDSIWGDRKEQTEQKQQIGNALFIEQLLLAAQQNDNKQLLLLIQQPDDFLFGYLKKDLDFKLEAIAKAARASNEESSLVEDPVMLSWISYMKYNGMDKCLVSLYSYFRKSVGSGTTETEVTKINALSSKFFDYLLEKASQEGKNYFKKDKEAPVGVPVILTGEGGECSCRHSLEQYGIRIK